MNMVFNGQNHAGKRTDKTVRHDTVRADRSGEQGRQCRKWVVV